MGTVYYGIHPRLRIGVAVKILPPDHTGNRLELAARFRREARMAARVRSLHVVSTIDVDRENGVDYLVMEHVRGVTAHALLRERNRRGLSEQDALRICLAASKGLAAVHAAGVLHRDVKPSNILIPRGANQKRPRFEEARLADLGIARFQDSAGGLTQTSASLGTFGYMSPEQAQDARLASAASDVFSMGATLYALLAGRTPFGNTSLIETFRATLKGAFKPLSEIREDVSEATQRLTALCLSKNRADRPRNGAALAKGIHACLQAAKRRDTRRVKGFAVRVKPAPSAPHETRRSPPGGKTEPTEGKGRGGPRHA
jgi:serine/threonine protein kinase